MSVELIKAQSEQIKLLEELLAHKNELIDVYKENLEQRQQQFDRAMELLDESIKINKQLSEKTVTD